MFLQYRVKYLSIPHKAQIGKMNAVYCSLPVVADDVTGSKEIDVFLSTLLQRTEKGIQCLILVLYLLGNPGVKGEWVKRGSSTKRTGVSGCLLRIVV